MHNKGDVTRGFRGWTSLRISDLESNSQRKRVYGQVWHVRFLLKDSEKVSKDIKGSIVNDIKINE